MKEKFKAQLDENKTVTEESLALSKNKTYHNGDEVKVGDKPLFGMILDIDDKDNKTLTLIMLNESQIDLYEIDNRHSIADTRIPIIKLIKH
jgi:hypothetical protein